MAAIDERIDTENKRRKREIKPRMVIAAIVLVVVMAPMAVQGRAEFLFSIFVVFLLALAILLGDDNDHAC